MTQILPTKHVERLIRVEEQVRSLDDKVEEIKSNHLPHLAQAVNDNRDAIDRNRISIEKINVRVAVWSGVVIGSTAIIDYIIRIFR